MKFIYLHHNGDEEQIETFAQRGGVAVGPQFVGTCNDFELDERLIELAEKFDVSSSTFLVVAAEEYLADATITDIS